MKRGRRPRVSLLTGRIIRREAIGRIQSMESEAIWLQMNIHPLELALNRFEDRLKSVLQQIEIERNSANAELARKADRSRQTSESRRKGLEKRRKAATEGL